MREKSNLVIILFVVLIIGCNGMQKRVHDTINNVQDTTLIKKDTIIIGKLEVVSVTITDL